MSITAEAFAYVRDLVLRESSIQLGTGKEYLVEARLVPLARSAGAGDVDEYVARIRARGTAQATRDVVEALTTNETSWFRDGDPFAVLRSQVLPELARSRAGGRLRMWSAACSSGQEPYSMSMSVLETPATRSMAVDIVATDLSQEMVERARAGRYSQVEVNRGMPATTLVRYFRREGAAFQVVPEVCRPVTFRQLNLARPFPPLGRFDVVFLRNVLIYFDVAAKRDVLRRVRSVMAPDGVLFLGAAETTTGVDDAWERVSVGKGSMYRIRKDAR